MYFIVANNLHYVKPNLNIKKFCLLVEVNWDDWFEFETKYDLIYVNNGNEINIGSVKIGQFEMCDNQRRADLPKTFTQLSSKFFSLGQSDYYYDCIKNLGDKLRVDILTGLNDIAYNLDLYEKVKFEAVTIKSLMRSVNEFEIMSQFNRIAKGKARLTNFDIEYTYPASKMDNPPTIKFCVIPNSNPPTNIHVIIGRNNVGKTYLIKNIIKSIYLDNSNNEYGILKSASAFANVKYNLNLREQVFANVLCITFSPFDDYEEIKLINNTSSMPFIFIGLTAGNINERLADDFVKSLMVCQKSDYKIKLLENAINILETDPVFERSNIKSLIVTSDDNDESKQVKTAHQLFRKLSSGHQVIILTLTRLVESITEKSLVILDEPENHLHPPLLSAFIRALSELLIDRNGVAIIATHSPVILQEVPRSCVWKINRSGTEVTAVRLEIESFGASIGSLTREVFGLEIEKTGFHKLLKKEVNDGNTYSQIIEKFNNELGDEARMLLSALLSMKE